VKKISQFIERPGLRFSQKASFFAQLAPAALALFGVLLCFPAASSPTQEHRDDSAKSGSANLLERGKKLFGSSCAGCHGLDARGGEHAPDIAGSAEVRRMSDDQLYRIVHDGTASLRMPAFGKILNDGQIESAIAYLRSLQGRTGDTHAALPGDPAAGRSLFFGKAQCSQCHTIFDSGAGSGGFIASDLTGYAAARAPAEILRAITNPNENPNPRARTAMIVTRDGQKLTGFIRNQDNFSVQFQSLDGAFHLFERSGVASISYDPQSLMPADYSRRLTSAELNDLVSFLMHAAAADAASPRRNEKRHEDDDDDR
jgi:cytochrome c oxidase cbb3-type subunit 3